MAKERKIIEFKKADDLPPMAMSLSTTHYNKTGSWRNVRPIINQDKCVKCGICWKFCPDASIIIVDDHFEIDYEYCKGCGICVEECPVPGAMEMEEEER